MDLPGARRLAVRAAAGGRQVGCSRPPRTTPSTRWPPTPARSCGRPTSAPRSTRPPCPASAATSGPTVGITSTPVIDTARSEIFVVATEQVHGGASHHLLGLDLYTGAMLLDEVVDPASVAAPAFELQRTSLALADGRVDHRIRRERRRLRDLPRTGGVGPRGRVGPVGVHRGQPARGQSGCGVDGRCGPGHRRPRATSGWPPATAPTTRPATAYDDSDGVLKLSPTACIDGLLRPDDVDSDNGADLDLGSTAPALLPNGLVFEVGKSRTAYVLRQSALGGIGGRRSPRRAGSAGRPRRCLGRPRRHPVRPVRRRTPGRASRRRRRRSPCGRRPAGPTAPRSIAGGLVWSMGSGQPVGPGPGHRARRPAVSPSVRLQRRSRRRRRPTAWWSCRPRTSSTPSTGRRVSPVPPPLHRPRPGYWEAASDGGVFAFGSAAFYGSAGALPLVRPVVGMAATPDRLGYWLVASDGGVFAYGDAGFYGSTGCPAPQRPRSSGWPPRPTGTATGWWPRTAGCSPSGTPGSPGRRADWRLRAPVVGMAAAPDDGGYWLVASDGGVFAFGTAPFAGSAGGICRSPGPSWGWRPPPTDTATGWWPRTAGCSRTEGPASTGRPVGWIWCVRWCPCAGVVDREGLLARRIRWRDLRLRRRRVRGLDRRPDPAGAGGRGGHGPLTHLTPRPPDPLPPDPAPHPPDPGPPTHLTRGAPPPPAPGGPGHGK